MKVKGKSGSEPRRVGVAAGLIRRLGPPATAGGLTSSRKRSPPLRKHDRGQRNASRIHLRTLDGVLSRKPRRHFASYDPNVRTVDRSPAVRAIPPFAAAIVFLRMVGFAARKEVRTTAVAGGPSAGLARPLPDASGSDRFFLYLHPAGWSPPAPSPAAAADSRSQFYCQ